MLKHGNPSPRALELAAKLQCDMCLACTAPAVPNPAQMSRVTVFNHKIGIDVKNFNGWKTNAKIKALNIVDFASNFQVVEGGMVVP